MGKDAPRLAESWEQHSNDSSTQNGARAPKKSEGKATGLRVCQVALSCIQIIL